MLLRQTVLYLPAQVVGPVFQLISVIAWTHYLSPERMGVFALVTAAQELAYIATLFWFTLYTMRYHDVAAPEADRRRFLDTESAVILGSAIVSSAVALGLVGIIETEWSGSLVLAAIAYIVTRAVVTQLTDRARTEHDTLSYTILQIAWPVLGLLFGIALVTQFGGTADMVLWGYTLAQAFSIVVAMTRLEIGTRPQAASRDIVRMALKYGLPLLLGAVFVWVASNGLRFIVETFEGAAAVGLLTVGLALGLRAANFAAMLVTAAAFPVAMKRAREGGMADGQEQLVRNGVLLLVAMLPAAAGLWAISTPFVRLVVSAPFQEMTLQVLPMAIVVGTLRNLRLHYGEQVFLLHEKPMVPLYNDIIDALLAIIGGTVGLWLGGLPGAVTGAAVGACLTLLVTIGCGWHWYRYALPPADIAKVVLATVIMTFAVTRFDIAPTVGSLVLATGMGAVVYAVAIAALYPAAALKALAMLSAVVPWRRARTPS